MIHTDGVPTIANYRPEEMYVTTRTLPNGTRKYFVKNRAGAELSGLMHDTFTAAQNELDANRKVK